MATAFGAVTPAHAAPATDAERSQCLAIGIVYSQSAQQDAQLVQTLRSTTAQPTVDDLQTFKDLDVLHEEAAEIGSILQELYEDAPHPTAETITALHDLSDEERLNRVEACIPEA